MSHAYIGTHNKAPMVLGEPQIHTTPIEAAGDTIELDATDYRALLLEAGIITGAEAERNRIEAEHAAQPTESLPLLSAEYRVAEALVAARNGLTTNADKSRLDQALKGYRENLAQAASELIEAKDKDPKTIDIQVMELMRDSWLGVRAAADLMETDPGMLEEFKKSVMESKYGTKLVRGATLGMFAASSALAAKGVDIAADYSHALTGTFAAAASVGALKAGLKTLFVSFNEQAGQQAASGIHDRDVMQAANAQTEHLNPPYGRVVRAALIPRLEDGKAFEDALFSVLSRVQITNDPEAIDAVTEVLLADLRVRAGVEGKSLVAGKGASMAAVSGLAKAIKPGVLSEMVSNF